MPPTSPELTRWFSEQIQPHEPKLKAWLRAKFPQLNDVDDLVQDTYLRLLRAKGDGMLEHPKAYLFTTAKHAALDRCRRRQIVAFESVGDPAELERLGEGVETAVASDLDLEIAALADAINALPARCREIVILQKRHGLTRPEIAQRLGVSQHTVNAQLTIGLMKCREHFRRLGLLAEKSSRHDET